MDFDSFLEGKVVLLDTRVLILCLVTTKKEGKQEGGELQPVSVATSLMYRLVHFGVERRVSWVFPRKVPLPFMTHLVSRPPRVFRGVFQQYRNGRRHVFTWTKIYRIVSEILYSCPLDREVQGLTVDLSCTYHLWNHRNISDMFVLTVTFVLNLGFELIQLTDDFVFIVLRRFYKFHRPYFRF